MRRLYLLFPALLMLGIAFGPVPAMATKPCTAPDEDAFARIVAESPLILRGTVAGYHTADKNTDTPGKSWTDINVIEIFRGGIQGRDLRIAGWAAMDMPLYNYETGSELIFLLKPAQDSNDTVLADSRWSACVPSLMPRLPDGNYAVNAAPMRLETFLRSYIRSIPGMKKLSTSTVAIRSGKIYIQAMMGPTRPVMHVGDPEPPDVPAPDVTVEIYDAKDHKIAYAMTDSHGKVAFDLPAGTYRIEAHPRPIARPLNTPMTVKLAPGAEERITLDIDTGIR